MMRTGMRTIACLSFALWQTTAIAEKRIMTSPAFGCPSAYETSHVLQMRREGLGVDGHVTEEVDRSSRSYMNEHKCRFLKKGDTVDFEWSNVQKLEPASLGHAVCIRFPNSDECAFTPKNFAEARSAAVQEEVAKEPATRPTDTVPPTTDASPQTADSTPVTPAPGASVRIDLPAPTTRTRPKPSNRIELSPL
jgi:hypothetical protein